MFTFRTFFILCMLPQLLFAAMMDFGSGQPKSLKACRIDEEVKIDGLLDEAVWINSGKASGFIQTQPIVGKDASYETEVCFLYSSHYIYVGAKLHDPEPEKILKELSIRDEAGNADDFGVFFDPFKSGLNGFIFSISAAGVQRDAIISNQNEDVNWNAVWESKVSVLEDGWCVEMKIPYSAIRFPSTDIQEWGLQFRREIRRFREESFWNFVDPSLKSWVQQSGTITEIKNIQSPVRLSLTPYISGYLNTDYNPNIDSNRFGTSYAYNAGLDLKYGINDAFTLDMTVIPDFGQVISDNKVLNLSPFEVYFEENRQFFTEGTELFDKGGLFYSRRIGSRPLKYNEVASQLEELEYIKTNPDNSSLINATKLTGRTNKGTGVGFFNAIVAREHAEIGNEIFSDKSRKIQTNPITNYNAIVIDQNLPNNSYASIINTNVLRSGADYDANVTGASFNVKTKDQKYYIDGFAALSQKYSSIPADLGNMYTVELAKASGNWTYSLAYKNISEDFDPNDMGFLLQPNLKNITAKWLYTQYIPKNPTIQRSNVGGSINYLRLFKPDVFFDFAIDLYNFVLYQSRFAYGFNARIEPVHTRDYYEPRTYDFTTFLLWPRNFSFGGFYSTDYRKKFAIDQRINYRIFDAAGRSSLNLDFLPRVRFSDKISLFGNIRMAFIKNEPGFVERTLDPNPIAGIEDGDILMGLRERFIFDNSFSFKYTFTNAMGITLRIRHYWDNVKHGQFGKLQEDGRLEYLIYSGKDNTNQPFFDRNVNIFNIDLQYSWRFAPGSDLIFVWKNEIFNNDDHYNRTYFENLGSLLNTSQGNSFSIRMLYYLDYLSVFSGK